MNRVVIGATTAVYNDEPPYHPDTTFPESRFADLSNRPNPAYTLFRKLLQDLGGDSAHEGTANWNPLGRIIRPGNVVVVKPNFVLHENASGDDVFAVITHPSILRAVVDYSYIALQGQGRIIIADAPQMDCSWDKLATCVRLDAIQQFYRDRFGFAVEVLDLRTFELIDPAQPAYAGNRRPRPGDPAGSTVINLGRKSAFYGMPCERFYGADYNRRETIAHHHDDVHEYAVSKTILDADVFISVPKMKVHKKVGVTLNLKGLVGINTNKNCLIHYRLGTPKTGGDQLPDDANNTDAAMIRGQRTLFDVLLARQTWWSDAAYKALRALYRLFIKPFRPISSRARTLDAGNWHGNDSAWRMTADLAKIIFFFDRDGVMHDTVQRRFFCVVDGIIGGEGEGPLAPTRKPIGALAIGENPLAVDIATSRFMGFDPQKIRSFDIATSKDWNFGIDDFQALEISVNGQRMDTAHYFSPDWKTPAPAFVPHPGWLGHIEISS